MRKRHSAAAVLGLMLVCTQAAHAQTGPCTEAAVQGNIAAAADAFSYMPPYGKPVIGKPAIGEANHKNFSKRTNITRAWAGDHRIVAAPSGEMAYERGTVHIGYDENGKREEFDAVMLTVFKANGRVCEIVALTMQPLEEQVKP